MHPPSPLWFPALRVLLPILAVCILRASIKKFSGLVKRERDFLPAMPGKGAAANPRAPARDGTVAGALGAARGGCPLGRPYRKGCIWETLACSVAKSFSARARILGSLPW